MQAGQTPIIRTPNPAVPGVPQIRAQVNISGQQRISNSLLANPRIAASQQQVMQAQARALAAQAQAQGQGHAGIAASLAATAAPALQAHLAPTYHAARASSTSPGLPQQSPTLQQAVAASASPRPPSAQAMAGMSPQMQAALINPQRPVPSLAHYYQNLPAINPIPNLTPEQISHAMHVRGLLQVSLPPAAVRYTLTIW